MAPGDHALGTAEVGATGLARVLWPLPHRVMVCWGGWKPEGPVGGLTLVEVLQPCCTAQEKLWKCLTSQSGTAPSLLCCRW